MRTADTLVFDVYVRYDVLFKINTHESGDAAVVGKSRRWKA